MPSNLPPSYAAAGVVALEQRTEAVIGAKTVDLVGKALLRRSCFGCEPNLLGGGELYRGGDRRGVDGFVEDAPLHAAQDALGQLIR